MTKAVALITFSYVKKDFHVRPFRKNRSFPYNAPALVMKSSEKKIIFLKAKKLFIDLSSIKEKSEAVALVEV